MLAGIDAAAAAFPSLKLDTVVMRGVNDDELVPLLEFGRGAGAELRFIEYMDVGGATRWSPDAVVSRGEILGASRRTTARSPRSGTGVGPGGSLPAGRRDDVRDEQYATEPGTAGRRRRQRRRIAALVASATTA